MGDFFFTGFPGFLGSALLPRVLARSPGACAVCLVQPAYALLARRRVDEMARAHPSLAGRIRIVEGDLAADGLGIAGDAEAWSSISRIYHLAAIYDLSAGREVSERVNVRGMRNVLRFAEGCPRLERLHHVSTCYVSGRHEGLFREADLAVGQGFHNAYEETKYQAEMEVRQATRGGLPATVYRPAVVVGDSDTGATQKYDGPYFVIRWLLKQPAALALMPVVGDGRVASLNVVPRDFVADAIAWLGEQASTVGQTYQLADPAPLSIDDMLAVLGRATGRRIVRIPLPLGLAKTLGGLPGIRTLTGIPPAAMDYFAHQTRYATDETTKALEGSGISCPPFAAYAPALVEFVRGHPDISAAPMV